MDRPVSELTYKIVTFPEITQVDPDEGIDWAVEMIALGYEGPALYMLAGFKKPANYFEISCYILDAVKELGLERKSGDEAILSYPSYHIRQLMKGERTREHLTALYRFCQANDYEAQLYDFYLLYWAWDDLDYEDAGYNYYWPEAGRDNIEQIVVHEAKKWIENNKESYEQYEP